MKRSLLYISILLLAVQALSCKKTSSSSVTIFQADTVSGTFLINWMGIDHSYTLKAKDTTLGFTISQGTIITDTSSLFAKHLRIYLTDRTNVSLNIYAHKLDETQDTGIYYVGTTGGYYYGDFRFDDLQTRSMYSVLPTFALSYVHVTQVTKGVQNNMKGNFHLTGVSYGVGASDTQVIRGEFDITR